MNNTGTVVKKKVNFDSMWISAKFPTGGYYKFTVNRNGEKLEVGFSNDPKVLKEQTKIFAQYLKFREGENNEQRFNRLEELTRKCWCGKQLISLMV